MVSTYCPGIYSDSGSSVKGGCSLLLDAASLPLPVSKNASERGLVQGQ